MFSNPTTKAAVLSGGDLYPQARIALDYRRRFYKVGPQRRNRFLSLPGASFSRTGAGYAETQGRVLVPFASGEPRITDKGLLVEGASTNLLLWSQEFNIGWGNGGVVTVATDVAAAPDGTMTADRLTGLNTGDRDVGVSRTVGLSPTTVTGSLYVKGEGADIGKSVNLRLKGAGGALVIADYPITLTAGWQRVTGPMTMAGDNTGVQFIISGDAGSANPCSSALVWGAQLEAASFASSYIPTTGAQATRGADLVSLSGLSISAPVSVIVDFERIATPGYTAQTFHLDAGSASDRLAAYIHSTGEFRALVTAGGETLAEPGTGLPSLGGVSKGGVRFAQDDVRSALNGTLGGLDSAAIMPVGLASLRVGSNGWSQQLHGYVRRVIVYPRAFSDAELQGITQ